MHDNGTPTIGQATGSEPTHTAFPTRWLQDSRLSHTARGLLVELVVHAGSPYAQVDVQSLSLESVEAALGVAEALRELQMAGYLRANRGSDGRVVYDLPDPIDEAVNPAGGDDDLV